MVQKLRNAHAVAVQSLQIQHGNHTALVRAPYSARAEAAGEIVW